MSLYRRARGVRRRTAALALLIAVLAGAGAGFALGRSGRAQPTGAELVARLSGELRTIRGALVFLPTEYPQAYRGSGNESAGVREAMARIRRTLDGARADLRAIAPAGTRVLEQRIAALDGAVRAKQRPARVAELTTAARQALAAVPGGG